jgi:hypothetical protein
MRVEVGDAVGDDAGRGVMLGVIGGDIRGRRRRGGY